MSDDKSHDKYSRQELIPGWDQSALTNANVIVAGVGAIGSYVATILASSGIGKLILIDMDKIELSNLNRQLLFREADLKSFKAEISAKRLKNLNPDVEISHYNRKMEKVPLRVYEEADVIIGCLDTFIGRRWINSMAVRLKKPLILGGMFSFLGDVQVIFPYSTPCFECQPLVPDEELAQACTPFGDVRKDERDEKEEEAKLPAVATLSSIIGGWMAQETIKILLEIGNPINNYLFYDGLNNAYTIVPLARNKNCPACGELYNLEQIKFIASHNETITDLLVRLSLSYGLEKPEIMIDGMILEQEKKISSYNLSKEKLAFVLDTTLAKPIKVVLEIVE